MNKYADGDEQSNLGPAAHECFRLKDVHWRGGARIECTLRNQSNQPIRQQKLTSLLMHNIYTVFSVECYLIAMWPQAEGGLKYISTVPAVSYHFHIDDSFQSSALVCIWCFLIAVKKCVTKAAKGKHSLFWLLVRIHSQSRWERNGNRFSNISR